MTYDELMKVLADPRVNFGWQLCNQVVMQQDKGKTLKEAIATLDDKWKDAPK